MVNFQSLVAIKVPRLPICCLRGPPDRQLDRLLLFEQACSTSYFLELRSLRNRGTNPRDSVFTNRRSTVNQVPAGAPRRGSETPNGTPQGTAGSPSPLQASFLSKNARALQRLVMRARVHSFVARETSSISAAIRLKILH